MASVAIRREENELETRTPLTPDDINYLKSKVNIETFVQPAKNRIFSDDEFKRKGAIIEEDIHLRSDLTIGLNEIPAELIQKNKLYLFSTQLYKKKENLKLLLKKMASSKSTLIDYERITDKNEKQLIHFGNIAGNAGMIDSLWALGKKLYSQGLETPFLKINQTFKYSSLEIAIQSLKQLGKEIDIIGLNYFDGPLIIGILGNGIVCKGAIEIINCFSNQELKPDELEEFFESGFYSENKIYFVIFQEKNLVKPKELEDDFDLQDYYENPSKYESQFAKYIPYLTVIINATYWDNKYPKFITIDSVKKLFEGGLSILRVIGDITCIENGSNELTIQTTTINQPLYEFNLNTKQANKDLIGKGPAILAIDNLFLELPKESSRYFSSELKKYIPQIIKEKLPETFEQCTFPEEIKKGIIMYKGKLTPNYTYLQELIVK